MQKSIKNKYINLAMLFLICSISLLLSACTLKQKSSITEPPSVSVITIDTTTFTTYKRFSGNLEGITNIEIRPQVAGYLEKIYVDEGAYVYKSQALFQINDHSYNEQLNNANAALLVAKANAQKEQIEVSRLEKLVEGKAVSQVQLDHAKAILDAQNANVVQAEAVRKSMAITKAFTVIKAPVNGYIGRIPYKIGSLVGHNEPLPLTLLSDIHQIYAYFSVSENDFLKFKQYYKGNSIEDKITNIPPVTLLLPDDSEYPEQGRVEMVEGQFDKTTAAITFRAVFPNANGLLRSGNTGTVILSQSNRGVIAIPQSATFEMQNKVMVYILDKDNKISNASLTIIDKDEITYLVSDGLQAGDRIVTKGLERLKEGITVTPVSH